MLHRDIIFNTIAGRRRRKTLDLRKVKNHASNESMKARTVREEHKVT